MTVLCYKCRFCGYLIPFDPSFDIAAIKDGSVRMASDGRIVSSCSTTSQVVTHIEKYHPEVVEIGEREGGAAILKFGWELVDDLSNA